MALFGVLVVASDSLGRTKPRPRPPEATANQPGGHQEHDQGPRCQVPQHCLNVAFFIARLAACKEVARTVSLPSGPHLFLDTGAPGLSRDPKAR